MKRSVILLLFFLQQLIAFAQMDDCFIYGTITTKGGQQFTGSIRWNNEETLWTDYFQAIKSENKYHYFVKKEDLLESFYSWLKMKEELKSDDSQPTASNQQKSTSQTLSTNTPKVITEEELKILIKEKIKAVGIDEKEVEKLEHVWVAHFGDIKSIAITGSESVDVTLKNGEKVHLKSGSNDFNTDIRLIDQNMGELLFQWDKIDQITFSPSPKIMMKKFGKPLFGTINSKHGIYTGYIQWDYDKTLDTDKLICQNVDGELGIEFKNISTIAAIESGHMVTLNSGKTIKVEKLENNDPNNIGVNIWIDGLGKIYFPIDLILSTEFSNPGKNHLPSYNYFPSPTALTGSVFTKDNMSYVGTIAYDLDEEYDFELIQGLSDGLYYSINLRNIKEIVPLDKSSSTIKLRVGKSIVIGNSHDVASSNSGILIFEKDTKEPIYVKWANVSRVVFN